MVELSIGANNDLPYRSIKSSFDVRNLPSFITLIGKNGVGKSQLLELLARRSDGGSLAWVHNGNKQLTEHEILLINEWGVNGTPIGSLSTMQNERNSVYNDIVSSLSSGYLVNQSYEYSGMQRQLLNEIISELSATYDSRNNRPSQDIVFKKLPEDFFSYAKELFNEKVGALILEKKIDKLDKLESGRAVETDTDPVSLFNSLCIDFGLSFKINAVGSIKDNYTPLLVNTSDDEIDWSALSSGEKVLLRIICWLFHYRMTGAHIFPKLLLLDEPDAHLNPSMLRKLIVSIRETLVQDIGMAVIITTHTANTVALSDEDSLYELKNDGITLQIEKIAKQDALELMSEGLLIVRSNTRFVFVEDNDDVSFYTQVYEWATQDGRLETNPTMKFVAASKGDDSGGKTKVIPIVDKFNDTDISSIIWGLCDRDYDSKGKQNVKLIGRYSFENYIYDPLVLAVALIIKGKHMNFAEIPNINQGEWSEFLNSEKSTRQVLIDAVCSRIEDYAQTSGVSLDTSGRFTDKFYLARRTGLIEVDYPNWVSKDKGKDTIRGRLILHASSPFHGVIDDDDIKTAYTTLRMVPLSLLKSFRDIMGN